MQNQYTEAQMEAEGGVVDCSLCGGGEETVQHFVIECGELREVWSVYSRST